MSDFRRNIIEFLDGAKTSYHTVSKVKELLDGEGYVRLYENEEWNLVHGGKYYVVRNGSSIIAFRNMGGGFMICASHSDSPAFRVKSDALMGAYVKLETEKYGGMINYTWFDRPLTVAGRVSVRRGDAIVSELADIGNASIVIPSLAIHMNRTVNENCKFNPAQDLLPLASLSGESGELLSLVAKSVGAKVEDIVSHELYLVCADKPQAVGFSSEILLSPRIDNLGCVYTSLLAFLSAKECGATPILAVFDNEEVGSATKQGAGSTFLYDTLLRISADERDYLLRAASSFMVSADNAHAVHPNHPEMADKSNAPVMSKGIVIKYNANQRYTTDSFSDAIFRTVCDKAGVKPQSYYNRADLPGGSTLGSISDTKVSVPTVDIGIPQLAMHSANECMAFSDAEAMVKALEAFYSSTLSVKGETVKLI